MAILYLGNKNYSSWSLRAWLAAKLSGIDFEERMLPLSGVHNPQWRRFSPTARVPALHDAGTVVWDSLAIAEYLAERHPGMWPTDSVARAWARCVAAEMHSGMGALRNEMTMSIRERLDVRPWSPALAADVARVTEIWNEGRQKHGAGGAFLCGAFSLADAFYAPVAFRFQTYRVEPDGAAGTYLVALLAHPWLQQWQRDALAETAVVDADEPRILYRAQLTRGR
jgi:glutathione S-transferase